MHTPSFPVWANDAHARKAKQRNKQTELQTVNPRYGYEWEGNIHIKIKKNQLGQLKNVNLDLGIEDTSVVYHSNIGNSTLLSLFRMRMTLLPPPLFLDMVEARLVVATKGNSNANHAETRFNLNRKT